MCSINELFCCCVYKHTVHFHVLYFCIMYFGSVWVSGLVLPYTKLVKAEDVHLGG